MTRRDLLNLSRINYGPFLIHRERDIRFVGGWLKDLSIPCSSIYVNNGHNQIGPLIERPIFYSITEQFLKTWHGEVDQLWKVTIFKMRNLNIFSGVFDCVNIDVCINTSSLSNFQICLTWVFYMVVSYLFDRTGNIGGTFNAEIFCDILTYYRDCDAETRCWVFFSLPISIL